MQFFKPTLAKILIVIALLIFPIIISLIGFGHLLYLYLPSVYFFSLLKFFHIPYPSQLKDFLFFVLLKWGADLVGYYIIACLIIVVAKLVKKQQGSKR